MKNAAKKAVKSPPATSRPGKSVAGTIVRNSSLTGEKLRDDMKDHRQTVTASRDSARGFLERVGVLTPKGKLKQLIRG